MQSLSLGEIKARLDGFDGRRVLIVGDLMLDAYLRGSAVRLSPEAPVPVVTVGEKRWGPGGAANVAANVLALGGQPSLAGVVGGDPAGDHLRDLLRERGLSDRLILTDPDRPTTTKTRVIVGHQQLVRFDEETDAPIASPLNDQLADLVEGVLESCDILVFEDYDKGTLSAGLISRLIEAARARGLPSMVDPKVLNFLVYQGATLFKPNDREVEEVLNISLDSGTLETQLSEIRNRAGCRHVLVTRGSKGMVLLEEGGGVFSVEAATQEVYDVAGAGDTVTAVMSLALAAGYPLREGAILANFAAASEVRKLGVAPVSRREVLSAAREYHEVRGASS